MTRVTAYGEPSHEGELTVAIVSAVLSLVAREGFEGATFRRVAAEAGCSTGAVQKRFATRSDLLRAGLERVVTDSLERIAAGTRDTADAEPSLVARQCLAARETLPLDDLRRDESMVWTAYVLRAALDHRLGDVLLRLDEKVQESLVAEFVRAQESGELADHVVADVAADAVLALVDGFAIRMLWTPSSGHAALLTALDAGVEALLPRPAER